MCDFRPNKKENSPPFSDTGSCFVLSDPSSFVISSFESFSKVISPDAFGLGLFPSPPPVTPESPPPYGVLEFEPSNDNEV